MALTTSRWMSTVDPEGALLLLASDSLSPLYFSKNSNIIQ